MILVFVTNNIVMFMNSISAPPSTRWSRCSKDQLVKSFEEGQGYCLHNVPETVYDTTPDCGNGIVEDGEECDCGNAPEWVISLLLLSSSSSLFQRY